MIDYFAELTNVFGAWPNGEAVMASGAGTGDGTEIVKILIDNGIFGWQQALIYAAGLLTDGVTEAVDTSQILKAIRCISGHPGECVEWWGTDDPSTVNARILILTGQVVAISTYPEMCAAVYCGDANNGTAAAFYKTSDAGGTTRNVAGAYMVLPDCRGYFLRGLDVAHAIDPDGASRTMGHAQLDASQGHKHHIMYDQDDSGTTSVSSTVSLRRARDIGVGSANAYWLAGATGGQSPDLSPTSTPITDGANGTPRTATETRSINRAVKIGIRY